SDLAGAGTNPVLSVHNLTFAGNGIVPINGVNNTSNQVDVQNIQTKFIDNVASNNGVPALPSDLSSPQQQALYADSWWYNSPTGVLQGVNDGAADVGNLTDPAWQLGPIAWVGTNAYTWTPNGLAGVQAGATGLDALGSTSGTNARTGQYMIYSGTYGPSGVNALDASQFVNGMLTVPIAQIATTGNIWLPGTDSNAAGVLPGAPGSGTYIELAGDGVSNGPTGNGTYNVLGGFPFYSPYSFYNFSNPQNLVIPEPGSMVLAGLGVIGFLVLGRRRSATKAPVTNYR
ncbi:MAG TPA: PEP-CTERM sorting domain-containing protein, partial [Pirellulales bacterium]|nr:PEP-CTERM sorting domain-containing protein [Pirellulales bacterium]